MNFNSRARIILLINCLHLNIKYDGIVKRYRLITKKINELKESEDYFEFIEFNEKDIEQ